MINATTITAISGRTTNRVRHPNASSNPQAISVAPTKGPITSGYGMPIAAKRPAPRSAG